MEQALFYSNILLWVSILFIFLCLFFLFRQFGEVYLSTANAISKDGIPIGKKIPKFEANNHSDDSIVTNYDLNRPTLLVFISPNCKACKELLTEWEKFYHEYKHRIDLILVGYGTKGDFQKVLKNRNLPSPLLIDKDGVIVNSFRVRVSPFAFMIDKDGKVTSKGVCNGAEHIESYIDSLDNYNQSMSAIKTS